MAPFGLPFYSAVGLTAGALILAVGTFALVAKPRSTTRRLFFLLALVDGLSTIFFHLARLTADDAWAARFRWLYWYHFLLFVTTLWTFAIVFPRPPWRRRTTRAVLAALWIMAGAVVMAYVAQPTLLWRPGAAPEPLGNVVNAAFFLVVPFFVARLVGGLQVDASESRRTQAGYVFGAMVLAFGSSATTVTANALAADPVGTYFGARGTVFLFYWTAGITTVAVIAHVVWMMLRGIDWPPAVRRFLVLCYAGLVAVTATTIAYPRAEAAALLRSAALLVYPLALAFAMFRYELFDIDRHVRRAATITMVVSGAIFVFVIAQNLMENVFEELVFSGIPSDFLAGILAALMAAVLGAPISRGARTVGRRIIPELGKDDVHRRKLEIYRHGLEGALADGLLSEKESLTLKALRTSMGITMNEHQRVLDSIQGRVRAGTA